MLLRKWSGVGRRRETANSLNDRNPDLREKDGDEEVGVVMSETFRKKEVVFAGRPDPWIVPVASALGLGCAGLRPSLEVGLATVERLIPRFLWLLVTSRDHLTR